MKTSQSVQDFTANKIWGWVILFCPKVHLWILVKVVLGLGLSPGSNRHSSVAMIKSTDYIDSLK